LKQAKRKEGKTRAYKPGREILERVEKGLMGSHNYEKV